MSTTYFNQERTKLIGSFKAQGYSHVNNSSFGAVLEKLNKDGFVEKRVVTMTNQVLRYKPWKPSPLEQARLSSIDSHRLERFVRKEAKKRRKAHA